jgi:predicted TIM-barrel fold metal-dependent hydrolase
VVFGSDWPMADPAAEIAAIRNLGLTDDEVDGILGGNVARLLGLDA